MFFNKFLNAIDFCTIEAFIILKANWTKPKLSFFSIALNVNVGWFIPIARIAEETVWADSE
jgi:hypothetical protein